MYVLLKPVVFAETLPAHSRPLGLSFQYLLDPQMGKVANLANKVLLTIWKFRQHFDQKVRLFFCILRFVVIFTFSRPFSGSYFVKVMYFDCIFDELCA